MSMPRFPRSLVTGAAVALCACTPMQWVKQDATPAELRQDSIHCQQEAWREARARSWYFRPMAPVLARDALGRQFFAWPGSAFADPYHDPFLEEGRLAQFCMRSKGYELVPVSPPPAPAQEKG